MIVRYSKRFQKQFHSRLSPKMRQQFGRRLELFLANPRHSRLNVHSLSGKYAGCWSMNVSGDVRAIFEYQGSQAVILFLVIGTHAQLY
ncbi:MAG: type II toxin-antitoxin system mRNA interferase toxin, RelE/StbE family [Chloroflexi bacterium]|nr:type II toxin-antitoxin system mRNA interferase toxin, RelE/StbE family [Chloroflexota bacterium]